MHLVSLKVQVGGRGFKSSLCVFLSLANDWLSVVAADVVELDAVVVDSVQNSQAGLTALAVVGLGAAVAEKH